MEEEKQHPETEDFDAKGWIEEIRAKKQKDKTQIEIELEDSIAEWHQAYAVFDQYKKDNNLSDEDVEKEIAKLDFSAIAAEVIGKKQDANEAKETDSEEDDESEEEMDPEESYVGEQIIFNSDLFMALTNFKGGQVAVKLVTIAYRRRETLMQFIGNALEAVVATWEQEKGAVEKLTTEEFEDESLYVEQYRTEKGLS